MATPEDIPSDRAGFRAWARRNHPDVGGDPAVFAAAVEAYRRRLTEAEPAPDPRFEAPVEIVVTPGGARGLATRIGRWWTRKRRPPRVK
ncbi:hypothetical protein JOF53_002300 [Crossiella equi]|uniref:J domain-containing protein n=1 Tax=Crossiella equi TaxID=130796 RepID=A0ABS5AA24_9PSEU|nr:hypothetical protein [Crossiella equi]MBP2473428.1 hypothetical protein [Crossiella equi]